MALNSSTVNVGDTATASQYNNLRKDVLQYGGDFGTTAGSATAYTVDIDNQFTRVTGCVVKFIAHTDNTGTAPTLNVEGTGAGTMKKKSPTGLVDIQAGDIQQDQIYFAVWDGTYWQIIDALAAKEFVTPLSGEALTAMDAVYLKSSDGRLWKTDADSAGEIVENFVGFAAATVGGAGTAVKLLEGGVISGFSGLTAGSVYYLSGTAGAISTTPGTIHKPVGIALDATTLLMFPTQAYRHGVYNGSLSLPAAGGTADTQITFGFRPRVIRINGILSMCDSGGTNCRTIAFNYTWDGTTNNGGVTIKGSGSISTTVTPDDIEQDTNDPIVSGVAGTNRSSLAIKVQSIDATSVTLRLTNVVLAGSGSTNGDDARVTVVAHG